ncbi:Glycine N-Methyltransferase [Manis pentadactyla]|nr:Glycine N-Methyltransferase [Manis pentadactyla]
MLRFLFDIIVTGGDWVGHLLWTLKFYEVVHNRGVISHLELLLGNGHPTRGYYYQHPLHVDMVIYLVFTNNIDHLVEVTWILQYYNPGLGLLKELYMLPFIPFPYLLLGIHPPRETVSKSWMIF